MRENKKLKGNDLNFTRCNKVNIDGISSARTFNTFYLDLHEIYSERGKSTNLVGLLELKL